MRLCPWVVSGMVVRPWLRARMGLVASMKNYEVPWAWFVGGTLVGALAMRLLLSWVL